ncbi:MAG: polysaccharide deacetylase family protein [Acidimicrobiales bacterium]
MTGEQPGGDTLRLPRGAFCLSIDLELSWGVWDCLTSSALRSCAALEREIVQRLLALFRTHDIPVTWAFVGRLLDDSHGFDGLRGDRACWYAPDLVDSIRRDPVDHELATHSYGHIYFGESSSEAVRHDLSQAKALHQAHGLPFRSLVFPRNQVAHLDVVAEAGIEVFRSVDAGILGVVDRRAPRMRPIVNLADKALPSSPPVVEPVGRAHGLIELPSSLLLIGRNGLRRIVTPAALRAKLRAGLTRAADTGELFHLWFHPSNFYTGMAGQLSLLDAALGEAATLRRQGSLDVLPMGALGSALRAA